MTPPTPPTPPTPAAPRTRALQVCVLGSAEPGSAAYAMASEAGALIARLGFTLVSGCGSPATRVAAERAVALDPRSEHFRRLGAILVTASRIDEARTAATRATEQAPRDPWTWHDLGLIEERHGSRAAAVGALQRARDLAPENPIFAADLKRLGAP